MCFYVFVIFLSLTTCAQYIGGTITTIAFLFIYKYIMFNTTLIVVRQPSIDTKWAAPCGSLSSNPAGRGSTGWIKAGTRVAI